MADLSAYARKAMLDWVLGGATPTRPTVRYMGLSGGSPTSTSGSEMTWAGATPYVRKAVTFGPAASPGGSVSNSVAFGWPPSGTSTVASGWQIWDASVAGNMLMYGLLDVASNMSASSCAFSAGSVWLTMR